MIFLTCLQSIAVAAILLFPDGDKALQGDLKAANEAYLAGKYPDAIKLFTDLAAKNDKNAHFALGRIYQTGAGLPEDKPDLAKAEAAFRKAAGAGHDGAKLNLAALLLGDQKRMLEGIKILKDLAASGSGQGLMALGQLYAGGQGVEQNFEIAKELFEKATAAGEADAYMLLGQMSEVGKGSELNLKTALELYEKAAQGNSLSGMMRLATLYANGAEGLEKNLAKAKEWLTKAAEKEQDGTAALNLGVILEGFEKQPVEAYKWYLKSAEQGNPTGMVSLAAMQSKGTGVEKKDPKEPFGWYEKAAQAGSPLGMYALSQAYEKGEGTAANPTDAKKWLLKAALSGSPVAMRQVADGYRQGTLAGIKDLLASVSWFKRAIDAGDGEAVLALSAMLVSGEEIPRDLKTAITLLSRAAEAGSAEAQVRLADIYAQGLGTTVDLIRSYALLLVAGEYEPAKAKREELALKMSKDQLAEAQKEFDRLRAKPAPATPAPAVETK